MFIACNSDTEEDDAISIEDYILDLGYENCLICHAGGKAPIADHCKEALGVMVTLDDCFLCHLDMKGIMLAREDAYRGCAACYLD